MVVENTFYVETFGCSFNQADTDKITTLLINQNFVEIDEKKAEFFIINTCAVKSQTQDKILTRIRNKKTEKEQKIIITGCLPWISKEILNKIMISNKKIIGIVGFNSFYDLEKINDMFQSNKKIFIEKPIKNFEKSKIFPCVSNRENYGIVQISEGCLGNCSYCCTKISRGKLLSYPLNSIIDQINHLIQNGLKEIYITSQDLGLYSYKNYDLYDLLLKIVKVFSGKKLFIRLGMLNPEYLIKNSNKILEVLKNPLFYEFLHIPIQSASDNILIKMKRNYSVNEINAIFENIRKNSRITISTDIICGFPGESEEDHYQTNKFIEKFKPDILNISKFTPRPGTLASNWKQTDSKIIKNRTKELTSLYNHYIQIKNKAYIGNKYEVIILRKNQKKKYPLFCRNKLYKPIVLKNGNINTFQQVKIIDSKSTYLIGEIV